jgi:hypothetical protein
MSQSIPNLDAVLEYAKVMASNEELHPDLQPYLEEGAIGPQLRHPLVYLVPLWGNGHANALYEQKVKAVKNALANQKYSSYIFLHERPYRLNAFTLIQSKLSDTQYWSLLSDIWTDTENQWQGLDNWKQLLSSKRPSRHYLMNEEEFNLLQSLPENVVIYRGCQPKVNENGLSWTLNKKKAEFFANRFGKKGIILERTISKNDIVAVLLGRGESEVIWEEKK